MGREARDRGDAVVGRRCVLSIWRDARLLTQLGVDTGSLDVGVVGKALISLDISKERY